MSTPSSDTPTIDATHRITDVVAAIRGAASFFLVTHVRPDGDAVGSISGLAKSLRKAGKRVGVGLADPPPPRFAFLLDDEIVLGPDQFEPGHDVLIVLDAGDEKRTGFPIETDKGILVNIDHHASNTRFGEINYVDTGASSTCEMVCFILAQADFPLDQEVAECLYLGLLTDSRFFQNENLRPSAHRAAARLLETGFDSSRVLSALTASRSREELRVLGWGLQHARSSCDGRLLSVILTRKVLQRLGATSNHAFSCGLFNQLTSVEGVLASVAILEGDDGRTYCEFRSRGGMSVKDVAVAMGGGGHLAAAGCNQDRPTHVVAREAMRRTQAQLKRFLESA